MTAEDYSIELDTSGMRCPMPVLRLRKVLAGMHKGQVVKIIATDDNAKTDIPAFCDEAAHQVLSLTEEATQFFYLIEK